ncbi:MAG TPA: hypothetical protein VGQ99_17195 [Tepidisphaeraceae bacterium]|jgi:hypothetical protein|nr:hypothetical protein [Tepidisphaeraceae bacterium]
MTNDQSPHPDPFPEYREKEKVAGGQAGPNPVWKRRLILAAEVVLVMVIVALLIFTWLPAFIGARPGAGPRQ